MSINKELKFKTIAFDADDTLWRNEDIFMDAQDVFVGMLLPYHDESYIRLHLGKVQIKNLEHFGYGIKGFTLSMIETAIFLTEGRISGSEIHKIIQLAKEMVAWPIQLLPNIEIVLSKLKGRCQLMLITKGDLLDQEGKVARSGLAKYFDVVEVVSDKTPEVYRQILERHNVSIDDFLMIGNSLKSDVLPVLNIGAQAIHIPYHSTWEHEQVPDSVLAEYPQLLSLKDASQLIEWLDDIEVKISETMQ